MHTLIKPKKTFSLADLKEVWQYKELLYFFSWRDFKVRYKQTAIGVVWAIFQPFITMVVFSIFFGQLAKMPSDGIPYPIFVYVGLLFWQFFSGALSEASGSLIASQAIITKVYFPRLILPISATITKFIDFAVAAVILVGLMAYYNYLPNLTGLLILPLLLLITFIASIGGGFFLAALNVRYRDVRYVLPFFIQIFLFLTPVIYPASIAGEYSWLLAMNPMTGVIKAARAAILGNAPINWELLLISGVACFVMLIIGIIYFKKTEKHFADVV
ncbi:MAG: ABC transporter permease [Patescibacteria group bacterium]|nr:ABC transporter permease [Patescibacteria group bacterium]MBU1421270.1 ABC transporter permease [Patescibacteria group bacterium]MBU2415710.1 ABC transporter permease [Patescibacteria group bacterium]MBU2474538.1 ABC transporter permease [Patescibacteria group bacterium]